MKRLLLIALLMATVVGIEAQTGKRILVACFSWSGSTKALAEEIRWLDRIGISDIMAVIDAPEATAVAARRTYTLDGVRASTPDSTHKGVYITNGKKMDY